MFTITVSIRFRSENEALAESFASGLREGALIAGVQGTVRTQVVGTDSDGTKTTVEKTNHVYYLPEKM